MTHRVVFAPEASAQIIALYRYIAKEASQPIAQGFTNAIMAHCEGLDKFHSAAQSATTYGQDCAQSADGVA
ncbi:MAG TPA: hypothetical protein VIJ62_01135 [Rhizomicrobium sp.]|jgi:hypothetical protein